jgi:acetylornithine deacetylase
VRSPPAFLRHLRDYVAIPSVNPMGRTDIPEEVTGERRYAEHLQAQLRALGLDAALIGSPERPSVIAEARAAGATDTLLVASHLDTVPVDGMEIDPFDPRIADGRLYGRGACDTKAGMAALVAALEATLAQGRLRRTLIVVGESDEELGSQGAHDVLAHLAGRLPAWCLATEPTELRVVNTHKGIALLRLRARGEACHSSDPSRGRNAIVTLSAAVLALDELCRALADRPHPRLGPATCSVNQLRGGSAFNIVPAEATLVMDRRLLPGESADTIRAEIRRVLAGRGLEDEVEITSCRIEKDPLGTPDDHPAVRICQRALEEAGLDPRPGTVAFGTDAGVFAQAGLPGVVLGPGSVLRAHTAREYVELDQVESMTALFRRLLEAEP